MSSRLWEERDNNKLAHHMSQLPELPPEKQARITEILNRWGILPEKHEEYVVNLCAHIDMALDTYFNGLQSKAAPPEAPQE